MGQPGMDSAGAQMNQWSQAGTDMWGQNQQQQQPQQQYNQWGGGWRWVGNVNFDLLFIFYLSRKYS